MPRAISSQHPALPYLRACRGSLNRRNLLLLCDFGFAVCFALLILITLRGNVSTISIYVVLVLLGVVRSFNGPVSRAIFLS
jgi:hypothetical protein